MGATKIIAGWPRRTGSSDHVHDCLVVPAVGLPGDGETACNEANFWFVGAAEAKQGGAIAFPESKGVQIHT
jgi:hypothetical protein